MLTISKIKGNINLILEAAGCPVFELVYRIINPHMSQEFTIHSVILNRTASIRKSDYFLSTLKEGLYSVSVERVPLIQYYAFFDSAVKAEQIKIKIYKAVSDGKWYDAAYSEDAQTNSPEFGIPAVNAELKKMVDFFEESLKEKQTVSR